MKKPIAIAFISLLLITTFAAGAVLNATIAVDPIIDIHLVSTESGLPLAEGNIRIDEMDFPIHDGIAQIRLPQGEYKATITGAYRQPQEIQLVIGNENTEHTVTVDTIFSSAEIDLLAKITRAEAEGESLLGKTAVAASILNRVKSQRYPSSINEVVYQRVNGRYQYSPVADGRIRLSPRSDDYEAAYHALTGQDPTYGATGFYNPRKTRDQWVRSHPVTTVIDGHTFFKY